MLGTISFPFSFGVRGVIHLVFLVLWELDGCSLGSCGIGIKSRPAGAMGGQGRSLNWSSGYKCDVPLTSPFTFLNQ
jgi:hypothetical protein